MVTCRHASALAFLPLRRAVIDQIDATLADWLAAVVGKQVEVKFDAPDDKPGPAVSAYLLALLPAPPLRGERRAPLQLGLRYLVSTSAPTVEQAHALLGALVFAAMARPDAEVELDPPQPELWLSLGARPRPCFYLKLPLRHELPEADTKLVTRPLVLREAQLVAISGRVLGPGDIPLTGARVSIPGADVSTATDHAGCFRFGAVPADPVDKEFVIRARRHEITVKATAACDQPVVIRFEALEG